MSIYYPSGCDDLLPEHVCDPCEGIEQGRIRSIAFIKKTFEFTDPSSPTEWQAGFDSGNILLIPATRGTYDGGAEVLSPGYGDQVERLTGYNHTLQYFDPNYKTNCSFYNTLKTSRQWKAAYRTSSQIHLIESTVQVIPKAPVQDDPNTDVVWDIQLKWSSADIPCPYDVPVGIFDECVVNV